MNTKEFTLQKGFVLPILKSLSILDKESNLKEIIECMKSEEIFIPKEGDLDKIDFNGKIRFINAIEYCIYSLTEQGFVIMDNNTYSIPEKGLKKLNNEWINYEQNNFVKKVDILHDNKYIYSSMPTSLFYNGHKKTTVYGFKGFENKYVKFLNDFIDYIDLNYPAVEEMIHFFKNNYNFKNNNQCVNAINVLRSCGLAKVIGKNLSLTKLGQWYINSYDNFALFRIFACIYSGFEEIFYTIAINENIATEELKQQLQEQFDFEWINTEQFEIRLNWLKDMNLINNNTQLQLTDEAIELAEFLGIIDLQSSDLEIDFINSADKTLIENNEEDTEENDDLDNIIDDLISESFFDESDDSIFSDEYFEEEEVEEIEEVENKISMETLDKQDTSDHTKNFEQNLNLSQQERNFLLHNVDIDNDYVDVNESNNDLNLDDINDFENIDDDNEFKELNIAELFSEENNYIDEKSETQTIDETSEETYNFESANEITLNSNEGNESDKSSVIVEIPKNNDYTTDDNALIKPKEISNLLKLPDDVISQICSALNMGKNLILTGSWGSGKTSIAVTLSKIMHQKGLNNGYVLASANENWTSWDTIGGTIDVENKSKTIFKEGFLLKSIRENKWLLIDELNKCDTQKCFDEVANVFFNYNTTLSYLHENFKNIEIISDSTQESNEVNQYMKNSNWRMIATLDTDKKQHLNFSPSIIRKFAFIEVGFNNYSELIDEYFEKNNLQNDLLKSKVKSIFSQSGLLKFKDIGASSVNDLIQYISIRSKLLTDKENMHTILAEGLELYILPQLRILDPKILKEVETYLMGLFDDYENIKKSISKVL